MATAPSGNSGVSGGPGKPPKNERKPRPNPTRPAPPGPPLPPRPEPRPQAPWFSKPPPLKEEETPVYFPLSPTPPSIEDVKPIVVSTTTGIKQASPDIIVFDEQIDPDFLVQTFFEEFGGSELINISRHDLIDGEDVSYSPISNLSNLRQKFNPNNIISIGALQEVPTKYGIDLFARGTQEPYFDDNGDLVIEIDSVRPDESIEVELAFDGTINRIEL